MIDLILKTEAFTEDRKQELSNLIENFNIENAEIKNHKFKNNILYLQIKIREEHETRTS